MTQKKAELEILTLLEAYLLKELPRPRTRQQREAEEFWKLLLQRLREDSSRKDFHSLSDFVDALYSSEIRGLPAWNWSSTELREKYDALAA